MTKRNGKGRGVTKYLLVSAHYAVIFFFYFTLEVNERRQCFSPISILVTSKCRNVHCVKSKKSPYENVAQNDDEPDFSGKNRKNIGYKLFPVPDSRY